MLSLMLVVTCLGFVVAGTLFFLIFTGSLLLYLELWSIMIVVLVLLPDPLVWSAGALPKRRRFVHAVRGPGFFAWATWYLGFGLGS